MPIPFILAGIGAAVSGVAAAGTAAAAAAGTAATAAAAAAVAAAPTVATAAGTATAAMKKSNDNAKEQGRKEGRQEQKAEDLKVINELKDDNIKLSQQNRQLKSKIKRLEDFASYEAYDNYLIAAFAVSISMIKSNKLISKEEEEILDLIAGVPVDKLPTIIRTKVKEMYNNPPSFNTAVKFADKVDREYLSELDNLLKEIQWIGNGLEEKQAFYVAWGIYIVDRFSA